MLNLAGIAPARDRKSEPVSFSEGEEILADNAERLLGPLPEGRAVRILVTLPKGAAKNPELARELIAAGMDCARINCARGKPKQWAAMAKNVRDAAREFNRDCKILVDLAGPKLRTKRILGGKKSLRLFAGKRFELVKEGSIARKEKSAE